MPLKFNTNLLVALIFVIPLCTLDARQGRGRTRDHLLQLDTTGFPLSIGNQWIYLYQSHFPHSIPHLTVKTIIDTTTDRTRIVRIGTTTSDSVGVEYWSVIDGDFYVNSVLLYKADLTHDSTFQTTYTGGSTTHSFQLASATLFGSTSPSQIYTTHVYSFGFSSWSDDRVALGVGWYYDQANGDAGEGYYYEQSLIGLLINGVLYGDTALTDVDPPNLSSPMQFELDQNYPNPFNPSTTIRYQLLNDAEVLLTICDLSGQRLATLVNEREQTGRHFVTFSGSQLPSGVYFYQLQTGKYLQTRKFIIIK